MKRLIAPASRRARRTRLSGFINPPALAVLCALSLVVITIAYAPPAAKLINGVQASVGQASVGQTGRERTGASRRVRVVSPSTNHRVKLLDGRDLIAVGDAATRIESEIAEKRAQPLGMVAADFDGDGVDDLVTAYGFSNGGAITLRAGNPDAIYPNTQEARRRRAAGEFTESPFLSASRLIELPGSPDFVVATNFDNDGRSDVITAARGDSALYFLKGDGQGNLSAPERFELGGAVTALESGSLGAGDERSNLAVSIVTRHGAKVLTFHKGGGFYTKLPAAATSLAIADLDADGSEEIAIAAGNELFLASLSDQSRRFERRFQSDAINLQRYLYSSKIKSLVAGDFSEERGTELALVTEDGVVHIARQEQAPLSRGGTSRPEIIHSRLAFIGVAADKMYRARVSSSKLDDLILLDAANRRLRVVETQRANRDDGQSVAALSDFADESTLLESASAPVAVLALRLNADALTDLVVLQSGDLAPAVVETAPQAVFTVTTTEDNGVGSFRQAILDANMSPGADAIVFNIPPGGVRTINLQTPLPGLLEPVTIDGTTQPGATGSPSIVLNGALVGADPQAGLDLTGGNSVVRGLVIQNFIVPPGHGISIGEIGGNIVEGNFIGTDQTGNVAAPNVGSGVLINVVGTNRIGGTAPAGARNLISGNLGSGVTLEDTSGNVVQGNFIGTTINGSGILGNGGSGIALLSLGAPTGPSNNQIGGINAGNRIAFNNQAGVIIEAGGGNAILTNSVFANGGLGIDLDPAGINPNDPMDADTGANGSQNFPMLAMAISNGVSIAITGVINSTPDSMFRIEFFSSPACDPSGNGEGQVFLGATTVSTGGTGAAAFNVNLLVAVPPGEFITATATDPLNNTSEFSPCRIVDATGCVIVCPDNVVANSDAAQCGAVVNYPAPTAAGCGAVFCAPSSGSFFPVGVTTVNCTTNAGPTCSFTVTVTDRAPTLVCPANVTVALPAGQASATVNYPPPTATDNCQVKSVFCNPPSGAVFGVGSTTVNCGAQDEAGNGATCFFFVNLRDSQAPTITCPPNVTAQAAAGQNSATVSYPPPVVSDNLPGVTVSCAPASGSTFPLGVTAVNCTATDASGNQTTCRFNITVQGGAPAAVLIIENNRPAIRFGETAPTPARRKAKKNRNIPCGAFQIENRGFTPLDVTFQSAVRTGADVTNRRITDANEGGLYSLSRVNADGSETEIPVGGSLRIAVGERANFCLRFNPLIPAVAQSQNALPATATLPDVVTSRVTFTVAGGNPLIADVVANIAAQLALINPTNPRAAPVVSFIRSGNEFILTYSVFDADLDTRGARYELLDAGGQSVGQFDVDLAAALRERNLVRGQSFTVEQRFTGAATNPQVVAVRFSVTDGETTVTETVSLGTTAGAASFEVGGQSLSDFFANRGAVVTLPALPLPGRRKERP